MTTAPHWLDEFYPPSALVDKPRTLDKYTVEALGTFGLVLTVGVGLCSGTPFAALGIGVVLMALIYAGGLAERRAFQSRHHAGRGDVGPDFVRRGGWRTGWLSSPPGCARRSQPDSSSDPANPRL